jgi:hypothetical protein
VYNLSRASYHKEWDGEYEKPGIGARILAVLFRILPKIGPLKALSFRAPTPQTDRLFQESFNKTLDSYRELLKVENARQLQLTNRDFDTGEVTRPGEYKMADKAYSKLAVKLADKEPAAIDPKLRDNILAFFKDLNQPYATKDDPKEWQATVAAVEKLRAGSSVADSASVAK